MKWTLATTYELAAAHRLPSYLGNCNRLHGHNYQLEIILESHQLDSKGMVVDFRSVDEIVDAEVISLLDHRFLNEVLPGEPTAELIAHWVFEKLKPKLPTLVAVSVWENPYAKATFSDR